MKAFVFSIGEKTTDLCCELMEEYGFEVILYQDQTSLWEKLKKFYDEALKTQDQEFIRMDADIIPKRNVVHLPILEGWTCASGWDWYKQDIGAISIHRMSREIVNNCRRYINIAQRESRPESLIWRVPEINKFTAIDWEEARGLHGYGQIAQRLRIKGLKQLRNQKYDWELLDRIENL